MDRPDLRAHQQAQQVGPDREGALASTRAYLEAERDAGRVRADADVGAAATLLVGACHDLAVHRAMQLDSSATDPQLPTRLVDTLMAGLLPVPTSKEG